MKKNLFAKIGCFVLAVLMCCTALASCDAWNGLKDDLKTGAEVVGDKFTASRLNIDIEDNEDITVTASPMSVTQDATVLAEQTLVATVHPESLSESLKLVDWTVYWIDNQTGNDAAEVTDYVSIKTASDGSCTATVRAHKAFLNSKIGIKVTTRVGGYEALCTVLFEGKPTEIDFYDLDAEDNLNLIEDTINYGLGKNYIKVKLTNNFGVVSNVDYSGMEVVDFWATGDIKVLHGSFTTQWGQGVQTLTVSADDYIDRLVWCTVSGDILTVQLYSFVEELDFRDSSDSNIRTDYLSGAENVVFHVTVRDTLTGVTETLDFSALPGVAAVTLNSSEIIF